MFIRKYWIPMTVFILAIVGVGLYYLQTRPPNPPVLIVKPVEFEKPTKQPLAEVPEGKTSQGGHFHEDGTWHAEAHDPVEQKPIADKVSPGGHWSDAYLPPMEELEVKYADDSDAMFILDRVKILLKHESEGFSHDPAVDKAFAELMNFTNKKISSLGTDVSAARVYELMALTWPTLDNPPFIVEWSTVTKFLTLTLSKNAFRNRFIL